ASRLPVFSPGPAEALPDLVGQSFIHRLETVPLPQVPDDDGRAEGPLSRSWEGRASLSTRMRRLHRPGLTNRAPAASPGGGPGGAPPPSPVSSVEAAPDRRRHGTAAGPCSVLWPPAPSRDPPVPCGGHPAPSRDRPAPCRGRRLRG